MGFLTKGGEWLSGIGRRRRSLFLGVFLVVFYLGAQYPIQTTFPIGNDASRFIWRAQEVIERFQAEGLVGGIRTSLHNSQYPGAIVFLALFHIITPLSWPDTFVWAMVIAHLIVGLSIYWFLFQLWSWRAALIGFFGWGLTISVNHYFANGIFAHLLSVAFLLICLERLAKGFSIQATFWLVVTYAVHAISGLFLLLVLGLTYLPAYVNRSFLLPRERVAWRRFALVILLAAGIGFTILIWRHQLWASFSEDKHRVLLSQLLFSPPGLLFIFSPVGVFVLFCRIKQRLLVGLIVVSMTFSSVLLTFNHLIGVGWLVRRFEAYFIVVLVILSALAIDWLLEERSRMRHLLLGIIGLVMLVTVSFAIESDQALYHHFEQPNFARIHPDELAAIYWLKDHSSPESQIASPKNLHAEWIPIVTDRDYLELEEDFGLPGSSRRQLEQLVEGEVVDFLVLFSGEETEVITELESAQIVYQNPHAIIFKLGL